MHKMWSGRLCAGVALLWVVGCSDPAPAKQDAQEMGGAQDMASVADLGAGADLGVVEDMAPDQGQPPTYWASVKPIVHARCEGCHVAGGAGPYEMDSYASLKEHATLAINAIEGGRMPPWSPDPSCRHYKSERLMEPGELDVLKRWVADGMIEGSPADWTAPDAPEQTRSPDLVGEVSAPYTPNDAVSDDYRCFMMDLVFDADTYMTGIDVQPDNRQLVHHANLFLIPPAFASRVEALEAEDALGGYRCYGDAGISNTNLIGAWVPGSQAIFLPQDTAVVVPKGSRVVLQTHFNTLYAPTMPVAPEVHMYTTATPPSKRVRAMPVANLTFEVPAGEKESEQGITIRNASDKPWKVIGTAAHLHELATRVKVEVLRKTGETECLLDIPEWDFNWQQEYRFRDDEWVDVLPGERVSLTCVFDNSPENQPVVDGAPREPKAVRWGGKTSDEMCLNFLVVLEDYVPNPEPGPLCAEFKECRKDCDDPYGVGCIFNCGTEELTCGECLIFGAQACAGQFCRTSLRAATPCLLACAQGAQAGGDIDACLREDCPVERDALEMCIRPYIEQGLCNQYVDHCNVEL
jgi:hypothetical protein